MPRIALLLLCLTCGLVDGYRIKRKSSQAGGVATTATQPSAEADALMERASQESEPTTESVMLEKSVHGKSPRRRYVAPRRRAPVGPRFNTIGGGKCLSCGRDPRHIYKHGQGRQCQQLCASQGNCCAYSTSRFNNCLLWTQCEGLSAGGGHWGGAQCHVKQGFENVPCPTPAPPPSQFDVIGNGKCLSCGADPRHIYKHGQGRQCEQLCMSSGGCCAYSTSKYNNCLLWTQCEGLDAGGGHWGGAKCHVKKGFQNVPCPTTARPTAPPTAQPTEPPTAQPTEEPTPEPTEQPTEPPCPEHAEISEKTQKCIAYTEDWEEYYVREECCSK